ncbi:MAG TPA: LysM peptidoglycan-binding domain-containing protein [Methylotenera sp.]|nr:LysM peptidoglycan-binding domain-containing protein [Methylotenera sp.]
MFPLSVLRIRQIGNPFVKFSHLSFRSFSTFTSRITYGNISKLALAGLGLSCVFFSSLSYADSNVAGDEIIIYADDTYKPPPRNIGADSTANNVTSNSNSDSAPSTTSSDARSSRLRDALDTKISDLNAAQSDNVTVINEDLWQRIKDGYAMPDSTSELIAKHENWYSSRPDYMKRMVERSQKYLFHIVEEVEKRGMPTEIALLPMIESAYNPQANSVSKASGIWQFIPSTGKNFGLKQNWWVDNRRNVTAATDAALTYLQKLHAMFGAWDLALAAYNAGEGTVSRAIERNRRLGLPTDYESLNLPAETRNYVPKLQAIKNLMTNPENYGLQIQTIANSAYFTRVSAPAQIDARLAAKLAEISYEEFTALNPGFNRPVIASVGDKHELLLPISAAQTFKDNLAGYNKPLVSWQTYFAKRGERMDSIAKKFGIPVAQLRDVNDLSDNKKIKTSKTILVPNGHQTNFVPTQDSAVAQNADAKLQVNDTVSAPAIDITSVGNNSNDDAVTSKSNRSHIVKKGENIQTIAKRYGISVKQLVTTNSLKNTRVKVGQSLSIENSSQKIVRTASNNQPGKKKTYVVKRGDTLHSIAEKFDVTLIEIKRWNKNVNSYIQPGDKLTIMQSRAA